MEGMRRQWIELAAWVTAFAVVMGIALLGGK